MTYRCKLLLMAILAFTLIGCKGSLRVIHASSDAPAVDVLADGTVIEGLDNVDYKMGSGFIDLDPKTYSVSVDGRLADGTTTTVIGPADIAISPYTDTTVIALNTVSDIEPLIIHQLKTRIPTHEVQVDIVHASPVAQAAAEEGVDIYVTAADTDLINATPIGTLSFKETLDHIRVPSADYRIRITPAGSQTVVFDTGESGINLAGGKRLLVVAVDNTTSSDAPITLLVNDGDTTAELLDTNTQAKARVVHASPDAPEVEVFATTNGQSIELIDAFSYLDTVPSIDGGYVGVAANDYIFDVAPNTNSIGDSVYTSPQLTLEAGEFYSVFASGRIGSDPAFGLYVSDGDTRSVATEAKVNVVHTAPAAGTVDVYVTPAGDFSAEEITGGVISPTLADFEFGTITDFIALLPGDYDIRIVAGGAAAINVENFTLAAGSVNTLAAVGPAESATTETKDFGVIVLNQ